MGNRHIPKTLGSEKARTSVRDRAPRRDVDSQGDVPRTLGVKKVKNRFATAPDEPVTSRHAERESAPERSATARVDPVSVSAPRLPLTADDIESFKALDVEVRLETADGDEVWLVPERTGQERTELVPEDLEVVTRVHDVFPGASVKAFRVKKSQGE